MSSSYSLFTDPKIKQVWDGLPPEEQQKYKKQGEHMYNRDYEAMGNPEDKLNEAAAYISEGLKSGLRPSMLDASELEVMRTILGEKWFVKFNFDSEKD